MTADSLPTVALPSTKDSGESAAATPEIAMERFEARRSWAFALGLAAMSFGALAFVLLLGGDRLGQTIHGAALAINGIACVVYAATSHDVQKYRTWKVTALAFFAAGANATGFFYWGVYSAYAAVVPVSIYAFASGAGRKSTVAGLSLSAIAFGGLGVAQLGGWVERRGLIGPNAMSDRWQLVLLVMLQLVMIGAVIGGVDAYRTMRRVLYEHHAALRALAQREAQLAEAHAEMRDARAPGEGRHSGDQLGRFRLLSVLGRGAMGEVYAAEDERGQPCAVKVLAAHLLGNQDALRRFHREARAIASLDAPNIVRMLDVSAPDARLPYLAMERLEGQDLAELIKQQPMREIGEVVRIVREVAAGLDAAHKAGVVHRDLKPANLFAVRDGASVIWKILDFGVSKLADGEATVTVGQIVGTPGYMAPEQARGALIDQRADVYALAIVAYRLLTGRPAVVPSEAPAMLHEVVYRMPPRPNQYAAVSEAVESVLAVALAKSPDDRFSTAGELAAALAEAAAGVLSPIVTERATAILRRAPWGQWARGASRKLTIA
ncbi:MAG: serine/threonine protein kinase [Myxococcales bacterium]|nr:serine/threonine protein kinase [Myxococcales bacterium]